MGVLMAAFLLIIPQTNKMSDDKNKRGKQDNIRVDSNDPSEVEYLHRQFPHMTHEEIVAAIREKRTTEKRH